MILRDHPRAWRYLGGACNSICGRWIKCELQNERRSLAYCNVTRFSLPS